MTMKKMKETQGVVLATVLLLLLIASVSALAILSLVQQGQRSAQIGHSHTLAFDAAQAALSHCETLALTEPAQILPTHGPSVAGVPTSYWEDPTSWRKGNRATPLHAVPLQEPFFQANGMLPGPAQLPVCLLECTVFSGLSPASTSVCAGPDEFVVVTARGFSPDFSEDDSQRRIGGVSAWVQSISRIENNQIKGRTWRHLLQPPL
jgi:hypothetical protein